MGEFTIDNVIRLLANEELGDALDTALEREQSLLVGKLLDEMDRRDPRFEL